LKKKLLKTIKSVKIAKLTKLTRIGELIKSSWITLNEFSDILDRHHTFMLASGIAFNVMIYMIPLFLIAIYILSNAIDATTIDFLLQDIFAGFLPPTESNYKFLKSVLSEVRLITEHSTFFGIIGIGGLLWISSTLISSIRTGLNSVFELSYTKIFLIYRLKDILYTILFSLLIMIYSYALPIISFITDLFGSALPPFLLTYFNGSILFGVTIVSSFIIFYFIFRYVPNKKIPSKIVLLSTAICVISIELSRHIFAYYISSFANYGKFYGTYAIIISLAIWIYYSSLIILLSAEISKYLLRNNIDSKGYPLF